MLTTWDLTLYDGDEEIRTIRDLSDAQAMVLLKGLATLDVDAQAVEYDEHGEPTGSRRYVGERQHA